MNFTSLKNKTKKASVCLGQGEDVGMERHKGEACEGPWENCRIVRRSQGRAGGGDPEVSSLGARMNGNTTHQAAQMVS